MELWELIARESARDLVARYNACGDADELEEMISLFAPHAVMDVGQWGRHEGIEAIRTFFEGVRRPASQDGEAGERRLIRHFTATHKIDVSNPEQAQGQCYFAVLTNTGLDHWGRYIDQYGLAADNWQFTHRQVLIDGLTPGGWADSRQRRT